ncbi:MAG: hypothetical protein AAGE52_10620 [Myxococcota bacterium]
MANDAHDAYTESMVVDVMDAEVSRYDRREVVKLRVRVAASTYVPDAYSPNTQRDVDCDETMTVCVVGTNEVVCPLQGYTTHSSSTTHEGPVDPGRSLFGYCEPLRREETVTLSNGCIRLSGGMYADIPLPDES